MRMETPAQKLPCSEACQRIKIALLEDDFDSAQRASLAAAVKVHEAEHALARAKEMLRHAQAREWVTRSHLFRAKRTA